MLPDEALKSMKVMFATPCYISAVSMHYVTSIFELTLHSAQFGLQCILHMNSESLITRARNKMVIKFLSDETLTHLFWIDSDIAFTPQSVCRLLLIDRDVTAGVYPMKNFNWPAAGLPAGSRASNSRTATRNIRSIRSAMAASGSAPMPTPTASSKWRRRRPASCASSATCSAR